MAGMEKRGFHFGGGVTSGVVECLDKQDIIATHTYEYIIYICIYICVCACMSDKLYDIIFFDIA